MADGYWNRQPSLNPSFGLPKRPRPDYDFPPHQVPSGHEMLNYLPRDEDRGGTRVLKDTKTLGSAYDRYLQSAQLSSFGSGEASNFGGGTGFGRGVGAGTPSLPVGEPDMIGGRGPVNPDLAPNGRGMGFGGLQVDRPGREMPPLPPDASSTLFVEGLPPDSTRREVGHIFRPFLGFKEVRLVNKEPRHRGGDPLILCFVDFTTPACAATALNALQGYKMDLQDPDSSILRLQFARFPGPRSGPGPRGKR
ncbi:PREDICTED: RNA-binding protein 1-like isoform X2 [Nelumbo nucifera]|uniref:RNA-binding protein 1-like isoform X2 n=1 Tax=Nelumbo nucifera TaxID=4432 RepID=A0A1U8AG06_NELNU|nr:PREDICTED: RNA-binding protein 1-like isoform X2 [Nelumbo nucifera]XP_019053797.1 PREDICTED: RNA-binding protein 1-like isoform X2 [Nelumbo nucifera]